MNIVGLHGFWGEPSEFDQLQKALGAESSWYPNMFIEGPLDSSHAFADWTGNFLKLLQTRFGDKKVHLVGYSQGARLALHAVLRDPQRFEHVWLLSAHPGQLAEQASADRKQWIQNWQRKFAAEPWEKLVNDWNSQEVFTGSGKQLKPQVSRALLAQALENWSLLKHEFDWEDLGSLLAPTTWVFGALDKKFLAVKEELQRQDVTGEFRMIDGAGHRLLTDAPEILAKAIRNLHERT